MAELLKIRGFAFYISMVFLNAFVDLGHKIIVQNTVFKVYEGGMQVTLTAIVNALILLPFIAFFTPAGFLSDKYPKPRVMRISAWAAVVFTTLITVFYNLGWFWAAFVMTFLLAVQSAFYSPAKYGYIKELVGADRLAAANGIVQAVTTVAILAGVFIFSIMFEAYLKGGPTDAQGPILERIAPIGYFLILASLIEVVLAYSLPATRETDETMTFDWSRYRRAQYLKSNLTLAYRNETIFLSIVGLSVFWAIAQVVLAAFPAFAKETMELNDTVVVQGLLACSGIGIVIGSVIAGRVSRDHIETGLIPIGAFGVAATLLLAPVLNSSVLHGLNFIALGVLGGLFIIPLNALIQYHAAEDERGRVLASNNFIQNVVMLTFLGVTVLFSLYGFSSRDLFLLLVVVALLGAVYTVYKLPQALVRIITAMLVAQRYRIEVVGFDRLPERGGVLLLGNHISWIDWAIIQIVCPRPVRFVMYRGFYERWYLKWFLDFFGVIPIGGAGSRTALDEVRERLNEEQVVCLFPEGVISRTGQLSEFKRGYEAATHSARGVIVPFYLRGLWGTAFSRSSAHFRRLRGYATRQDISVSFGSPLPMTTAAAELKRRIFDLSIESWQRHTENLEPIPRAWLTSAKRLGDNMALANKLDGASSGHRLITDVILFSRLIKRLCPEQHVGLLLPTSGAGAVANLALLMRGKTVVNINYTANREGIAAAIRQTGICSIVTSRSFLEQLAKDGKDIASIVQDVRLHYMDELSAGLSKAARVLTLMQAAGLPAWLLRMLYCRRVDLDTPAAILFSSGSEGQPKGVVLSHRNIMANLKQIADVLNTEDTDVVMATLPQFHAFGLVVTTFMPLVEGIPVVFHPDPTDVVNIAKLIATYQATILCGTATVLGLYAGDARVNPLMLESLRIVVAGGEKLPAEVHDAFKLKFNKNIFEGYGTTETTPVASVNIPDRLDTRYWQVQVGSKPGTVGMPLPGTSFRIVDPETLEELPTATDGLILIGGAQVMLGYLADPERTARAVIELEDARWYKTGDKGRLDEDGFLTVVDRYSRLTEPGDGSG